RPSLPRRARSTGWAGGSPLVADVSDRSRAVRSMGETSGQPLPPLDVPHEALVLDLPGARPLLHVLELAPHLALEGLVELEVLLEDGPHPAAQRVILAEHLVDVVRVHQHLDALVEQEIQDVLADLDPPLLG